MMMWVVTSLRGIHDSPVCVIETFLPLSTADRRRFRQLVSREEYREVQDTELTWADRLREEGREKGREEARRETLRNTLKRLLGAKFGPLQAEVEANIDAVDSAENLERYLDQVLTAKSLEELGLGG